MNDFHNMLGNLQNKDVVVLIVNLIELTNLIPSAHKFLRKEAKSRHQEIDLAYVSMNTKN